MTNQFSIYLNIFLPCLAFAIPFFVSGPQWLTGTLVNTLLLTTAMRVPKKDWFLTAVLPSLAAVSHGLVLGKFTPFLLYFLPFIWLGNLILMNVFLLINKPSYLGILLGAISKSVVLYFSALIFFRLNIVPALFLTSMGLIQFVTAVTGGTIALLVVKVINHHE